MFAGLISIEQPVSAWGDPDKILAALAPYSLDKPRDVWVAERQLLVQVATRTGSESAALYQHPESGVAVAFWGRLDNRPDLIAQLAAGHKAADDELIALAWLKWGEHCPEKLIGDFAFAIASPKTGTVFLARDVMGVKPLFYRADKEGVFFANSAAAFKPLNLGTLTPSQEWMARFLLENSYHHTDTAYEQVKKIPGAHSLLIHTNGRLNLRRYHQFVDDPPAENQRNQHWLEQYQAVWQQVIACRMPAAGMIGTENSGGLDSGSITAEIARQLGEKQIARRLFGFGYAYDVLEPEYIMEVARHCKITSTFLQAGVNIEPDDGWNSFELNISGFPNEHPNGTSHTAFYRECQLHNIPTLFSGFGGDEAVTLNAHALRRELYDRKQWKNLWKILPGNWSSKMARMALTAGRAKGPSSRLIKAATAQVNSNWQDVMLQAQIVTQFDLFQQNLDYVLGGLDFKTVNQSALYCLSQPYIATRLANCSLMASAHGVDYVWPLLDQRLIQQWLSTPSIWKVGPQGKSRYLHRRAVADAGPDKMVWKNDKDMGNAQALAFWDGQDNAELFLRLLKIIESLPEAMQKIVDVQKLKNEAESGLQDNKKGSKYAYTFEPLCANLAILAYWLNKA